MYMAKYINLVSWLSLDYQVKLPYAELFEAQKYLIPKFIICKLQHTATLFIITCSYYIFISVILLSFGCCGKEMSQFVGQ